MFGENVCHPFKCPTSLSVLVKRFYPTPPPPHTHTHWVELCCIAATSIDLNFVLIYAYIIHILFILCTTTMLLFHFRFNLY